MCRLYPLSYHAGRLGFSPDFQRYSCADSAGPRVYRLMREVLRAMYGAELIAELDRVEAVVAKRSLRVLRDSNVSFDP